jgi:hypothetical protein
MLYGQAPGRSSCYRCAERTKRRGVEWYCGGQPRECMIAVFNAFRQCPPAGIRWREGDWSWVHQTVMVSRASVECTRSRQASNAVISAGTSASSTLPPCFSRASSAAARRVKDPALPRQRHTINPVIRNQREAGPVSASKVATSSATPSSPMVSFRHSKLCRSSAPSAWPASGAGAAGASTECA